MLNKKRRALITGGTRGIGKSIAERLASDGIEVIVTGTKPSSHCFGNIKYKQVDFLHAESLKNFLLDVKLLEIDILVNNAGINKIGEFSRIEIEDFDNVLAVNLRAPFLLCQAAVPYMKSVGWGRIVNITSIFGNVTKEFRAPYSASKFGLDGLTAALAAEVAEFGVLANCVGPGFIDTELTRKVLGRASMQEMANIIPAKRLGQVDEIAALVSWLVSDDNTYLSGQNIMIDGGFSRI